MWCHVTADLALVPAAFAFTHKWPDIIANHCAVAVLKSPCPTVKWDAFESKVCVTNKDSMLFSAAAASLNAALLICVQESTQELARCNIITEHGIKTIL